MPSASNASPTPARQQTMRGLAGLGVRATVALIAVVAGAIPFLVLLLLVQTTWAPLEAFDGDVAAELNEVVSTSPWLVDVLRVVTDLGANVTIVYAFLLGIAFLWIREQRRLAAFLAVTGIGLAVLVPSTKFLIGRARPEVEVAVSELPSNASFPSGHAMLSFVTFGALVLVALPYLSPRARRPVIAAAALLVLAVGFTRLALGVHFVTDVFAGWALGAAWLAGTTAAFRAWEHDQGRSTPPPVEGLERVEDDFQISHSPQPVLEHGWTTAGHVALAAAAILAGLSGLGLLVAGPLAQTAFGSLETSIVMSIVDLRTDSLTSIAKTVDMLSGTGAVVGVSLATAVLSVAVLDRWRPAVFVAVTVVGEVLLYFLTTLVVGRARPDVPDLTAGLPVGGSWPSGHVAAAAAVYGSLAAVVIVHSSHRWRWAMLALPVLLVPAIAIARLYVAAHYPSDLVAGAVLGTTWTLACVWLLLRPQDPHHVDRRVAVSAAGGREPGR